MKNIIDDYKNIKEDYKNIKNEIYDLVIIGGGLSGLYLLNKLLKENNQLRICLLECSNRLGGRIETIRFKDKSIKSNPINIQYESGGARFSNKHENLIKLLKHLNLEKDKIAIPSKIKFMGFPKERYEPFLTGKNKEHPHIKISNIEDYISVIKQYIKKYNITDKTLINYTLIDFTHKFIDKEYNSVIPISKFIEEFYQYYSELAILNANDGLHLFDKEFNETIQYYILKNGYQSIIDSLLNKIKKIDPDNSRHKIYTNTYCKNISKKTNFYQILYNNPNIDINLLARHVVFATSKNTLSKINYLNRIPEMMLLNDSIKMEPLYRIYARYPIDKKTKKVWFNNLSKIGTNLKIKFIIPIDYDNGIIMISYTDSKYAKYWYNLHKRDNKNNIKSNSKKSLVNQKLKEDLVKLFPDLNIPNPLWIKHHYWHNGSGYWKKNYDSHKMSIMANTGPTKSENIYFIGSDFSKKQAWVEGTLLSANNLLKHINKINISNFSNLSNVIKNKDIDNNTINKLNKKNKMKHNRKLQNSKTKKKKKGKNIKKLQSIKGKFYNKKTKKILRGGKRLLINKELYGYQLKDFYHNNKDKNNKDFKIKFKKFLINLIPDLKEGNAKKKQKLNYKRIKLYHIKNKINGKKINISNKEKLRKFFLHNFGKPNKIKRDLLIFNEQYNNNYKYNKITIHFKIRSSTGMGGLDQIYTPNPNLILEIIK